MPLTPTSHLPTLLKRYETLTREVARLETERDRRPRPDPGRGRGTRRSPGSVGRDGTPGHVSRPSSSCVTPCACCARRASRCHAARSPRAWGSSRGSPTYRLDKAVELRFAEKLGGGLYRVTDVVPEL